MRFNNINLPFTALLLTFKALKYGINASTLKKTSFVCMLAPIVIFIVSSNWSRVFTEAFFYELISLLGVINAVALQDYIFEASGLLSFWQYYVFMYI